LVGRANLISSSQQPNFQKKNRAGPFTSQSPVTISLRDRPMGHLVTRVRVQVYYYTTTLCELDGNFPVCPRLFYGQYSFGNQHCQSLVTQLLLQCEPRYKRLTKTVVKCCRGYMWCACFAGSYTVERKARRRSLHGLKLHLHVPDNMMSNTAKTSQPLLYSKKLKEFRSSVTKSGSTPGGFPCMVLPSGTEIAHKQSYTPETSISYRQTRNCRSYGSPSFRVFWARTRESRVHYSVGSAQANLHAH
jgi:hypothetical protein